MKHDDKILVLGGRGLVGSALIRRLQAKGYSNVQAPPRAELDLLRQSDVETYFRETRPKYVILAAAKVGGIYANNTYRADFIYQNICLQTNVIHSAHLAGITRLLFLGSSCIYPKEAPQPMKEDCLLTGPLEPTNEPYAIAKIAGIKMAESYRRQHGCDFISVMPTNLYGINDSFDEKNSHVIPGLIARMQRAIDTNQPYFDVWGTGRPRREFLYVDDMADACIHVMNQEGPLPDLMNIGSGEDLTIRELATTIKELMGYQGEIRFDESMPDGTLRKWLDISRIRALGWKPTVSLRDGLERSIEFFRAAPHRSSIL